MNYNFVKSIKTMVLASIALLVGCTITSCDDRIEDENRFTFKGELIAGHLESNPEKFSHFVEILKKARIGKKKSNVEEEDTRGSVLKTLSTYGSYTCFAPTNEAIDSFLLYEYNTRNSSAGTNTSMKWVPATTVSRPKV